MKRWVVLALLLAAAGCAPAPQAYPPEQAIGYWVGRPIEEVIAAWGPPAEERITTEEHLFLYEASHYTERFYPVNIDREGQSPFRMKREELACMGVFEVDASGTVIRAEWEGYECHYLP